MKNIQFLAVAVLALLAGCASTKPTIYDANAIQSAKTWVVGFTYDPGKTEQTVSQGKGVETKVTSQGRPIRDLKLRDDITYGLKDKFGIDASRSKRDGSGEIRINPISFASGGYRSVDIEIVSPSGEVSGRITVENGDRNATFKKDSDFAEYATEAISKAFGKR